MTTITREQLHERARRKVKELEFAITQSAFTSIRDGLNEELELARIALAALEAEKGADPVVFTDERNLHHIARGRETSLIWGKQNQEVGDIPLYRHAQPAPVVPEEIPKGLAGQIVSLLAHNIGDKFLAQKIWNACRAAMLQGGEPVSQTYELPQTQFGQIADLYEMQFDDGRTCAFHTDGAKAAQWLLACDGNKVQEYVRLERYQEAVIGNSPVIGIDMASEPDRSVEVRYLAPPGYVMVPKVVTPEIGNAINEVGQRCTCGNCSQRLWDLLLASAPVQIDIEMLASALKNAPLAPSDNQGRPKAPAVPDCWISCSERMPEDEQEVIVHNKLGYRYVSYFDEHSGLFFDMRGGNQMNCIEHIFVTHWMPAPAAPKPDQN